MDQVGFRGPQVCSIVGITYRQLDYWDRTGLSRPSLAQARGSGSQRLYAYKDLLELKVIKQLLDGGVNLRDLETQMQWSLPRDGGVETLAGFLLMRLGHIPQPGESILFEGRRLTVVEMDNRRIAKIRVEPIEETPPAAVQVGPGFSPDTNQAD